MGKMLSKYPDANKEPERYDLDGPNTKQVCQNCGKLLTSESEQWQRYCFNCWYASIRQV